MLATKKFRYKGTKTFYNYFTDLAFVQGAVLYWWGFIEEQDGVLVDYYLDFCKIPYTMTFIYLFCVSG